MEDSIPLSVKKKRKDKRKLQDGVNEAESAIKQKKIKKEKLVDAEASTDTSELKKSEKIKKKKKVKLNENTVPSKNDGEKLAPISTEKEDATKQKDTSKKHKLKRAKQRKNTKTEGKMAKKVLESLLMKDDNEKDDKIQGTDETDLNHTDDADSTKKKHKKRKDKTKTDIGTEKEDTMDDSQKSEEVKKQAISYMLSWKNDKGNWSFKKAKQIWLIKNMYNDGTLNDSYFDNLVEYLEGSKGAVRTRLIETAQGIHDSKDSQEDTNETDNLKTAKQNRAKKILQALSE